MYTCISSYKKKILKPKKNLKRMYCYHLCLTDKEFTWRFLFFLNACRPVQVVGKGQKPKEEKKQEARGETVHDGAYCSECGNVNEGRMRAPCGTAQSSRRTFSRHDACTTNLSFPVCM